MTMTDTSGALSPAADIALSDGVSLELTKLIETRLIVQANTGSRCLAGG
jgi:hypothetical protein